MRPPCCVRPDFDGPYMTLAVEIASRSHCVKRQVGAVITKDDRVVATGYNGPPANTYHCDRDFPKEGCPDAKGSCFLAIHAEQNAIVYALEHCDNLKDTTMYVTLSPCISCAHLILIAGIRRVLYFESYAKYKGLKEDEGVAFLKKFKVAVEHSAPRLVARRASPMP